MSKRYFCDRCDRRLFPIDAPGRGDLHIRAHDINGKPVDLCSGCAGEAYEWWNTFKRAPEAHSAEERSPGGVYTE